VLAAEDRSFYENRGISPSGIARAFWSNLRGNATQGGSTITQQYAKNAYLSQERTYSRKFKEFFIAVKLARRDDKDKILEDYLNTIYFGRGAYGIETAAQTYFGKPASRLTVEQGAVLASVIRSPANYDPDDDAEALENRFNYVLDGMVAKNWLPAGDRAGMQVPKTADAKKPKGGQNFYLLDSVRRELKEQGFSDQDIDLGGLRVVTTFDRKAQRSAVRAVRQERPRENARNVHIGLSAVQPGTGAVLAMYGGSNAGELNEATQARVQPGSSFKPFALTGALRDDVGLRSRFNGNSPQELPGTDKEVNNEFDLDYGSSVDLVKATEDSINTAYVDLALEIGPRQVMEAAVDAGIPEDTPGLEPNAVIPLGTASVHNIDMANAYATFAAQGEATPWHVLDEVKGARRHPLQGRRPAGPGVRQGRDGRRELRAAAGGRERHRHRGPVARPPRCRQDRHRGAAAGHHDLGVVRRLHAADLRGGVVLQGHRACRPRRRRRPVDLLRRRVPRADLDRLHDRRDAGHGCRGVPGAGLRR
jgi:membrane peptidoglycan carboxypeptidase